MGLDTEECALDGSGLGDRAVSEAAFGDWVAPHLPAMMAVAVLGVGTSDAADVVQNALLRAWRRRDTFDQERGTPRVWLMAVLFDQLRRYRVRGTGRGMPAAFTSVTAVDGPEVSVGRRVDLDNAIRALPRRQRQVVVLYYLADLGIDEVARLLGIAPGSVKAQLSDARHRLRSALEDR